VNCGTTTPESFLKDALAQVQQRFVQVCEPGSQFVMFALAPAQGAGSGSGAVGGGSLELMSSAEVDPAAVTELMSFGFPEQAVRDALKATGGNKDAAANRLFG
jgi:hypothetical protein